MKLSGQGDWSTVCQDESERGSTAHTITDERNPFSHESHNSRKMHAEHKLNKHERFQKECRQA